MLTLVFMFLMLFVFGKIAGLALQMSWGLAKIVLTLIFLPVILIGMLLVGLLHIALPILIVIGVLALISAATE